MQIWLDTIDLPTIEKAVRMGILHGITTTPTMLASSPRETIDALLKAQPGPVAIDVTGDLISQAKNLYAYSQRIIIKIPATEQGWEAIHVLSKAKIPVMASAIVQPTQGLLAALAGAAYIAPYFSRILKSGDNPLAQMEALKKMSGLYQMKSRLIAVNPKTTEQIRACSEIGIDAITIQEDLFRDLTETHELTAYAVEQYDDAWKKILSQEWF